jgi:hypothetical protein
VPADLEGNSVVKDNKIVTFAPRKILAADANMLNDRDFLPANLFRAVSGNAVQRFSSLHSRSAAKWITVIGPQVLTGPERRKRTYAWRIGGNW